MYHTPVMLQEVLNYLYTRDGVYLDCTAGGGGHLRAILRKLKKGRIVAVDRDCDAVEFLRKEFTDKRVIIINSNFAEIDQISEERDIKSYDGILFDFGVSHHQLNVPERGFSFATDGMLDMRMDPDTGIPAREFINRATEQEIFQTIKNFGEDPQARKLARIIHRNKKSLRTTKDLRELIEKHIYRRYQKRTLHRVFQAFRIAVNDELESIKTGLKAAYQLLSKGGRIVCISYHSLEDRIVKTAFKSWNGFDILTKKPVRPSETEINANPAARSAKLRAGGKI